MFPVAPNGELVPAKIVQQPDGDYKVEYSSKYTGQSTLSKHKFSCLWNGSGHMVQHYCYGNPIYIQPFACSKIFLE